MAPSVTGPGSERRRAHEEHLLGSPLSPFGGAERNEPGSHGHSILVIAYHLLRDGTRYRDLGPRYFDEHDRQAVEQRLVRRLEGLGYQVTLQRGAA